MAKREMTAEEVDRLEALNQICKDCIAMANKNFQNIDRKRCMICPTGIEIHQLDPDDVDGHNSGRYERYFTA
ncbi:MAG: hypothetical protein HFJ27_04320 [Clostridia bacterium]|nr:hypothetical protein [Clostridia bacterium]